MESSVAASVNFKMIRPKELKEVLTKGLGPQIHSVVLFSNLEGSIVAKAENNKNKAENQITS
jgi:hypothetical protein